MSLLLAILFFAGIWKTFQKMGREGWEAIVPFYNIYILTQALNRPAIWTVLMLIPVVNVVLLFILLRDMCKRFEKGILFTLGLMIFSYIFWPILGFGKANFDGAIHLDDDLLDDL